MSEENRFNPSEHLMQIKNKNGGTDYLPVQWRLVWFREQCPTGTIDTEEIVVDLDREVEEEVYAWNSEKRRSEKIVKRARGYARFKAIVTDGRGGRATGTKSENAANFPDFVEKAETGSIGRALAALGYGTQFTGDEFNESHRIVDAPINSPTPDNNTSPAAHNGTGAPTSAMNAPSVKALRKRCNEVLGPNKWEPLLLQIIGANKPDDNILPEECAKLKRALDAVEERRAAKKAS